jgi:hypothetical protein
MSHAVRSPKELLRRLDAAATRPGHGVELARHLGLLRDGARPEALGRVLPGSVGYGARVVLEDMDDGEHSVHDVMHSAAMDVTLGHLSLDSPLGHALVGRREGETVEVSTPVGIRRFKVIRVRSLAELLDSLEEAATDDGATIGFSRV